MCHALLPSGTLDDGFKYVDSTVNYMVEKIRTMGIVFENCEIKVFGGAEVIMSVQPNRKRLSVGRQNIQEANRLLESLGIVPKAADVGGKHGRKLYFNSHTGDVFLKRMQK